MKYYSTIYMTNGCISLKPFDTEEDAESYNKKALNHPKYGPLIKKTKIVTRRINL